MEPKKIRTIYASAITFSPVLYKRLKSLFIGGLFTALFIYFFSNTRALEFGDHYPKLLLIISLIISVLFYEYISTVAFDSFYKNKNSNRSLFLQLFRLQGKWLAGISVLVSPTLLAIAISRIARMLSPHWPYISLVAFFIAIILSFWSLFYIPIYFIYFSTLLAEPKLSISKSIKYAFHLCCYGWLRITVSCVFFYCILFFLSRTLIYFYYQYSHNPHHLFSDLIILNVISLFLLPLVAAFNTHLLDDLRIRNTLGVRINCVKSTSQKN